MSGGDIRNAVLKAAMAAAIEPGPDVDKTIISGISRKAFAT